MATTAEAGLSAMQALALIGVSGVGAQYLAWRFRMPAIVLMLAAGLALGPVTGLLVPSRDLGSLVGPMISLAVSVILFEGGLTLSFKKLADARLGVRRLVYIGGPLGWALSTLALMWVGGLSWQSSLVFGGVLIVTGPTVIAPLLRQAKLVSRPAQVLQWEGIVNDALGALAAVLALQIVVVVTSGAFWGRALGTVALGTGFAFVLGLVAGRGLVIAFRRHLVPEYMKVPILFVAVLGVFSIADTGLHESGLLAVTIMGLVIANADLPSYSEIYRFKEHATILLVSGVFILLAAGVDFGMISQLNWRAAVLIAVIILVVRPATVMLSLLGTNMTMKERVLVALTGPRGVVLVAVSGIFAERLVAQGVTDGVLVAPLAFVLVLTTVLLHGFTLAPMARALGLTSGDKPGLLIVGGSAFTTGLAQALEKIDVNVLITDGNRDHLRLAREAGIETFYGDVLSEAAEHNVEFIAYSTVLVASDNDAYNTLVATDLAPEFGRETIWQLARHKEDRPRHALPSQLGGQGIGGNRTLAQYLDLLADGWTFRTTRLTDEYTLDQWREARPGVIPLAQLSGDRLQFITDPDDMSHEDGLQIVSMIPPELVEQIRQDSADAARLRQNARQEANDAREKQG
ncbi:sodium:proton antiporter [uncultured Paracoccus sp.]|uniref:cation:proton antiporter n=1 Tax=uncultured Paracoccus sp. TaxID=189685 RepID=UPI00261A3AE2|nr:sodium:proton antiporter [uncultured Paracoccus sp.]